MVSGGLRFSDEATAEYGLAVTRYSEGLEALAKARCKAEIVLLDDVRAAIKELGPSDGSDKFKTAVDWCKRLAFLVVGLTIAQGSTVMHQQPIERGSVLWLVGDVVVAALLVGVSLTMDFPAVKNRLARPS